VVGWRRTSKVRRDDRDDDDDDDDDDNGGGDDEHTHTHTRGRAVFYYYVDDRRAWSTGRYCRRRAAAASVGRIYMYTFTCTAICVLCVCVCVRWRVDCAPPRRSWWTRSSRPCARVDECVCANACLRASRRISARWAERAKRSPGPITRSRDDRRRGGATGDDRARAVHVVHVHRPCRTPRVLSCASGGVCAVLSFRRADQLSLRFCLFNILYATLAYIYNYITRII